MAGAALAAEIALLTLGYFTALMLNIRLLVPRLLLRNRLTAYLLSLLGCSVFFVAIEVGFECLLIDVYHLSPGRHWYLSDDGILFFDLLSAVSAYFISVAASAILFFLHLWNQSGRRLKDLKQQNTRDELEKVRTRIDSESLFDILDKAADNVRQAPAEVSALLMDLSKSLRIQLYESEYQRRNAPSEAPVQTFNLWSPALNLLTDRRYRLLRHGMLVGWFVLIASSNFHGTYASLLTTLLLPLPVYLSLSYLNIYVLIPKWLMRGRTGLYVVSVGLLVFSVVLALLLSRVLGSNETTSASFWFLPLSAITNVIKFSFPIIGVTVVRLFQYWVRNERQIAELETATLLSELEQLQNQVNPHFLFNMLNNIIVLTKKNPGEAAGVLRELSDMLKYQFRSFSKQSIRLGDDIRFLTDYLNLEKLRRDHFEFSITAKADVEEISLPPLLFIPFVENAVKHNNDNRTLSFVRIRFTRENDKLCFTCVNSKPVRPMRKEEVGGLGLPNIRRRLDLLYEDRYRLEITENEVSYTVQLSIEFKNKRL